MDGNQKFWLWFWLIAFSGISAIEHGEIGEAQEFRVFLEKGYTPMEAACAINGDVRTCSIVKEQNSIRVGK